MNRYGLMLEFSEGFRGTKINNICGGCPRKKVSAVGGHSVGHSKLESVHVHVHIPSGF